ncbi:MAG: serine/threonine-protein kinase [Planctomycetota bacterium]|nr:serine/threonine-protein kinase [Planctomycetota bacterium]
MNHERYQQVKSTFLEACEREGESRETYLVEACGDDANLRDEVNRMLAQDAAPLAGLETITSCGPRHLAQAALDEALELQGGSAEAMPQQIGPYRIIRVIGEGGMGIVYEAQQEQPKRTVALKVIRSVFASGRMLNRFEFEVQVLGRLEHPGIARIYEAGTSPNQGVKQPFFAMEYINGLPITEYAQKQKLDRHQRLELMARVCDAVQYAHQKGVIHLDLKPANILVQDSTEDSTSGIANSGSSVSSSNERAIGQPKVLDFGVARATNGDLQITTLQTDTGQLIGTIPYMSPEQISGDLSEIDARSDVYTLGVLLYQMLAGKLPHELSKCSALEAARIVKEREPDMLGTLNPEYRGDIETIVAKAMEKVKERRYDSAAQLGTDLRRYLRDEPINARPASAMYQLNKLARRNKPLVAGVLVAIVGLIGGTAFATYEAIVAYQQKHRAELAEIDAKAERDSAIAARKEALDLRDEATKQRLRAELAEMDAMHDRDLALDAQREALALRDEANLEAETAQQTLEFLTDIFKVAGPNRSKGETVTARDILDNGASMISDELADQPLVQARLMTTMGKVYQNLAMFDEATPMIENSLAIRRAELGDEHPDVAQSINNLAWLTEQKGDFDQAESLYREALELHRAHYGEKSEEVADRLNNLGHVLWRKGRYDEAETYLRQGLKVRLELLDENDPEIAISYSNLGMVLNATSRSEEAEQMQRKSLAIRLTHFGEVHPHVAISLNNVAVALFRQGKLEEALPFLREALAMRRQIFGDDHPEVAQGLNNLASVLSRMGGYEAAVPLFRETLELDRKKLGADHPDAINTLFNLATTVDRMGDHEGAIELFREAIAWFEVAFPSEPHWQQAMAWSGLGSSLKELQRFEEAEQAYLKSYDLFINTLGEEHQRTQKLIELVVKLYEIWGRPDEANQWKARMPVDEEPGP